MAARSPTALDAIAWQSKWQDISAIDHVPCFIHHLKAAAFSERAVILLSIQCVKAFDLLRLPAWPDPALFRTPEFQSNY